MNERTFSRFLPREHGFWVMLAAAGLSALARTGLKPPALIVACGTAVGAIFAAGLARNVVRRSRSAQLASAALLSLAGVPIEMAAGVPFTRALSAAAAWAAIFVASALVVRGAFTRARMARRRVVWLDAGAVLLLVLACTAFALANLEALALATGIALVAITTLVATRPTVKQLKPVGLALGGIATLAALAMSGW